MNSIEKMSSDLWKSCEYSVVFACNMNGSIAESQTLPGPPSCWQRGLLSSRRNLSHVNLFGPGLYFQTLKHTMLFKKEMLLLAAKRYQQPLLQLFTMDVSHSLAEPLLWESKRCDEPLPYARQRTPLRRGGEIEIPK